MQKKGISNRRVGIVEMRLFFRISFLLLWILLGLVRGYYDRNISHITINVPLLAGVHDIVPPTVTSSRRTQKWPVDT